MLGQPVDLPSLSDADLCLTYGAEGTMSRFLLMGVPQLISPWHVEAYMTARRVEAAGFGAWLNGTPSAQSISELVCRWTDHRDTSGHVRDFARRAVSMDVGRIVAVAMAEAGPAVKTGSQGIADALLAELPRSNGARSVSERSA